MRYSSTIKTSSCHRRRLHRRARCSALRVRSLSTFHVRSLALVLGSPLYDGTSDANTVECGADNTPCIPRPFAAGKKPEDAEGLECSRIAANTHRRARPRFDPYE